MNARLIEETFYLSEPENLKRTMELTDLSSDEIELIVGRFKNNHWCFAGKLKGEVVLGMDGKIEIRHHFFKKILWRNYETDR